tara:strand:- start:1568 stop:1813 length:246 start_codon:yes stop_codon:yes gene_type:complete
MFETDTTENFGKSIVRDMENTNEITNTQEVALKAELEELQTEMYANLQIHVDDATEDDFALVRRLNARIQEIRWVLGKKSQ